MASLKQLLSRPADGPPVMTITGEPGVGKTTLAGMFPKTVAIMFEDGITAIPVARRPYAFPFCTSLEQACGYVDQLINEPNAAETLMVDSVSQLGIIIEKEVIAADPKKPKSINTALGGYGAGLNAAAARHRIFSDKCQELRRKKGVAIVYVCHSLIDTIDPPDGDSFTRYGLSLDKRAARNYLDLADLVAFVRVSTNYMTKEDAKKARAISKDSREIICYPTGAHVSKNRYGIKAPIAWPDKTINPLLPLIPYYAT